MGGSERALQEKIRKKEWYENNKNRLRAKRGLVPPALLEPPRKDYQKIIMTVFFGLVILVSSGILIIFSVEVLGSDLVGYTISVLLEVGILSLAVMSPSRKFEWWGVKITFVFFVGVSFLILHSGNQSNRQNFDNQDKFAALKLDLVARLIKNSDQMPSDHTTKKANALNEAAKSLTSVARRDLDEVKNLKTASNLAIRIVLMLLNLIFCHAFYRLVRG